MPPKLLPGIYTLTFSNGRKETVVADNELKLAALKKRIFNDDRARLRGFGSKQGGTMSEFTSIIRPVSGADGPWWCVTRNANGTDFNITLGIANVGTALDQAKTDGAAVLAAASATATNIQITTTF